MEEVARAFATQRGLTFGCRAGGGAFKETFLIESAAGPMALKILRSGHSAARLEREIGAMLRCSHPNIARVTEVVEFTHQRNPYICLVEEFLAGGTLQSRLDRGLLETTQAFELGRELISVLAHLVPLGLVHRDFKPENIMFRDQNSVLPVVVDFGIVRDLGKESVTESWFVRGPGTPLFASPEQLNNRKELIDWRSDQFSIGVTLTYSLFGTHPFWEPGLNDTEMVERVARYDNPSDRFLQGVLNLGVPALHKMVMPYPIQRFRKPSDLQLAWTTETGA